MTLFTKIEANHDIILDYEIDIDALKEKHLEQSTAYTEAVNQLKARVYSAEAKDKEVRNIHEKLKTEFMQVGVVSSKNPWDFDVIPADKNEVRTYKTAAKVAIFVTKILMVALVATAVVLSIVGIASESDSKGVTIGAFACSAAAVVSQFVLGFLKDSEVFRKNRVYCSENFQAFVKEFVNVNGYEADLETLLHPALHKQYLDWKSQIEQIFSKE